MPIQKFKEFPGPKALRYTLIQHLSLVFSFHQIFFGWKKFSYFPPTKMQTGYGEAGLSDFPLHGKELKDKA